MTRASSLVTAAALALIFIRIMAAQVAGPFWGLNSFRYLSDAQVLVWVCAALVALFPPVVNRAVLSRWEKKIEPLPAWVPGIIAFTVVFLMPSASLPLLGDGMDRVEATLAGWKSLTGQPAPLDISIHVLLYKAGVFKGINEWITALNAWNFASYVSCGLAVGFLWKLSSLRAENAGERAFLFATVLFSGAALFFFGYVENYVLLAAALFGFMVLLDLIGKGRAPAWTAAPALAVLIGLHYFMVLLTPALMYALYKHGRFSPSWRLLAAAALFFLAFAVFAAGIVEEHYNGIASIFVSGKNLFGKYHLVGFANQQLAACPLLPVMLPLSVYAMRIEAPKDPQARGDVLVAFLGMASIVMVVFFFFLRPVLGPSADWDLFAVPSLFYTAWMALTIHSRLRRRKGFARAGWTLIVLAVASAGPWVVVHTSRNTLFQRYLELMEWEAEYNDWAASYGYLRLGKNLGRDPWERDNPLVIESLERACRVNPDSATVRLQAAMAMNEVGREDLARAQMAMHHFLMGKYHESKGSLHEAAIQFKKAQAYEPGMEEAADSLRRVLDRRDEESDDEKKPGPD